MLLAGRREFLLGPIGHVADLSLVLAEAVRLIRAIPTFTDPVELLRRRARSFVWFRLNWKRSRALEHLQLPQHLSHMRADTRPLVRSVLVVSHG